MKRKVLFVVNDQTIYEHAGIMQLSAVAKAAGHETALGVAAIDDLAETVRSWRPDVVAFSVLTGEQSCYLGLCRRLKAQVQFTSVFGGLHVTFCPEEFLADGCVDVVCLGEAEEAFPEFLDKLGTDAVYSVRNFWFRTDDGVVRNPLRPLIQDLDSIPWFHRPILYDRSPFLRDHPIKRFSLERGCMFKCAYCYNWGFHDVYGYRRPIVRTRSIGNLLAEIKDVRSKYPMKFLRFDDNLFSLNLELLQDFAERYRREIGLPFNCPLHPNMVNDRRARLLKRAGCSSVLVGVECGVPRIRKQALNRHMSNEAIVRACHTLRRASVRVCTSNMLGLPGETLSDAFETMHLNQRCRVAYSWATLFQPYPGTALGKYCEDHGRFDGDYTKLDSFFTHSRLSYQDPKLQQAFESLHRLFAIGVAFPLTEPLIRLLVKLPPNRVFSLLYKLWYGFALKTRVYPFNVRLGLGFAALRNFFRERKAI